MHGQIGDAVLAAPPGHFAENCRQVEQPKGESIELLGVVRLECHVHYFRRNGGGCPG